MPKCPFCDKEISIDSLQCIHCSEDFIDFMKNNAESLVLKWKAIKQKEVLVWFEQLYLGLVFWTLLAIFPAIIFYYFGDLVNNYLPHFSFLILGLWVLISIYALGYLFMIVAGLILLLINNKTSYFYLKDKRKIRMTELMVGLMKFKKLWEYLK